MDARFGEQIVVDVDDEIEALLRSINDGCVEGTAYDLTSACRDVVIDALLGPFGLTAAMLEAHDGGGVTTLRNFEHGVVAPRDQARHEGFVQAQTQRFDRSDYERALPAERKKRFKQPEPIIDAYTHRELPKDGRAHRDHVVSAKEIETTSKAHLGQSRRERVATANLDENKVWTEASINQSKSDRKLPEWVDGERSATPGQTNAESFGVDREAALAADRKAREAVSAKQDAALFKKQATELTVEVSKTGATLILRQVLALVLKEFAEGAIRDVRGVMERGFSTVEELARMVEHRLKATIVAVRDKWKEVLRDSVAAGLAGLFSEVLTLVINSFVTTAKNIVRIIREGCLALMSAVKLIVSPPVGSTSKDVFKEISIILGGVLLVSAGIAAESAISEALKSIPPLIPFSNELAAAIAGITTGVGSLLIMFAFHRLSQHISYRNKALAEVHCGQAISFIGIRQTYLALDQAGSFVKDSTLRLGQDLEKSRTERVARSASTQESLEAYALEIQALKRLGKVDSE